MLFADRGPESIVGLIINETHATPDSGEALMERRFAVVMAADIVGYSRMMGADEIGTLTRVQNWLNQLLKPVVTRYDGRIVKLMGDGALIEFTQPLHAVRSAITIQDLTRNREKDTPEPNRITLRIGINMGDILGDGEDIFGDDVNIAARLEGMAPPGGLLISQRVWEAIDQEQQTHFFDNGTRKFKNIAKAIAVWSWPIKLPTARANQLPRVHLRSLAGNSEDERRLAVDLCAEIRSHLARLTGLEVVETIENAHFLIDGSLRQAPSRYRIQARLLCCESDRQLWADRFDEATDDPFDMVDAVAPRLVMAVRRQVLIADAARLQNRPLDELSMTELMALAGASFFNPTFEGWQGAGLLAEQVLELAPDHFMAQAMAAAGLGLAHPLYTHQATPVAVLEKAFERIIAGLRHHHRSDMLHAVHCGLLLFGLGRHREAEAAARRSLEINPQDTMGLCLLAATQAFSDQAEAACRSAEQAVAINPADPFLHLHCRMAGYAHLEAGQAAMAVDWLNRADQLAPGLPPNLIALARAHQQNGETDEAVVAVQRLLRSEPGFRISQIQPLPYREPGQWDRFTESLRAAGAPE